MSNQHPFAASLVDTGRNAWLDADHRAIAAIVCEIDPAEVPFVLQSVVMLAGRMASQMAPEDWRTLLLEWSGLQDSRGVPHGR